MGSESFPPEISCEILLKLPVKSLLRCKSVCKEWYYLISDHHFIKTHSTLYSTNIKLIHDAFGYDEKEINNLISCPLYDVLLDKSVHNAMQLENPLRLPRPRPLPLSIVGSCNGLLCIFVADNMFIYNPSTRIWNELSAEWRRSKSSWYTFGYDESTHDYKLVETSTTKKVSIYSLKTGKWKELGDISYKCVLNGRAKFSNGALHWGAYESFGSPYAWRIVSLDLAKETFGEVLQPEYGRGDQSLNLGVWGDWLCVLCDYRASRAVDVWVMKVYGVKGSWAKLASISYPTNIDWGQILDPLCISNDGKVLLQSGLKLLVYDSKDGSSTMIDNFDNYYGCHQACIVVVSLASPFPPLGLANNNDDENQGSSTKSIGCAQHTGAIKLVLRLIERRNRVDQWIKYGGMILTFIIVVAFLRWVR